MRRFAPFLGRPRDTATSEDVRRFQLYQHEKGSSPSIIAVPYRHCALFAVTLHSNLRKHLLSFDGYHSLEVVI